MQTDFKKHNTPTDANNVLAAGKIQWYASDKSDTSIIAYGFFTENPKPTDKKKGDDFKITFKNNHYLAHKKIGKKFILIAKRNSLEAAQLTCR